MKVVITVVGKDRIGILALMCNHCADHQINILDVSQTILDGIFTMTMIVDTTKLNLPFADFVKETKELGEKNDIIINLMNSEIFEAMHRI